MKKYILPISSILFIALSAFAANPIKITGSDIISKDIQYALTPLLKQNAIEAEFNMGGSFLGTKALDNKSADIAIIAIPNGAKKPKDLMLFPIAFKHAVVAVNIANPIEEISTAQLARIYSARTAKRVESWQDLDINNASLKNIMPLTTSLSDPIIVEMFRYIALKGQPIGSWVNITKSRNEALAILKGNNSAIAVVGKIENQDMLKILAISLSEGTDSNRYAFRPDRDNIFNGDYPLAIPFYVAVKKSEVPRLKSILKLILSDEVASTLDSSDFISVPKNSRKKSIFELDIVK